MNDRILFHGRLAWLAIDASTTNPRHLTGLWISNRYVGGKDTLWVQVGRSHFACFCRLKGYLPDGRAILFFSVRIRTRPGLKWLRFCRKNAAGEVTEISRRLVLMPKLRDGTANNKFTRAERSPCDDDAFLAAQPVPQQGPLISVLMPVFNPPADCLEQAIGSLLAQTYRHWELCIADDASTDTSVIPLLNRFAASDSRIKVIRRDKNGHISAATNSALAMAQGEWCALLDQDDELSPHALSAFVRALGENPDAAMAFSDEDKIDETGRCHSAYRKSGWMPELLFGQNFVSHLGIYHTKRLRDIGGFREGFEGCQDWDMTLRFTLGLDPGQILHLPYILYHWRTLPHSTASAVAAKPYVVAAAERTVKAALVDRGINARLSSLTPGQFRVEPFSTITPTVAVLGCSCLEDQNTLVAATDYESLSFLPSRDSTASPLWQLLDAARTSSAEILVLLPPAYFPRDKNWLRRLVGALHIPGVAAAGGAVIDAQGKIEDGGLMLDERQRIVVTFGGMSESDMGYFGRAQLMHNPAGIGLHGMAIRRETLFTAVSISSLRVNDPKTAAWELGACLCSAGLRLVYDPGVLIDHDETKPGFGEIHTLRHILRATRPST